LLGVIQLAGASGVLIKDIVDIFEGLFKHGVESKSKGATGGSWQRGWDNYRGTFHFFGKKNFGKSPRVQSRNFFKHKTPFHLKANHILTPPTFSPRGGFLSLTQSHTRKGETVEFLKFVLKFGCNDPAKQTTYFFEDLAGCLAIHALAAG
jgi:hypothetical protein